MRSLAIPRKRKTCFAVRSSLTRKTPTPPINWDFFWQNESRTDEARRLFEQAITARRDHSGAINNLGVLYLKLNQVNDAVAAFQYGIEVSPESAILYINLAKIYAQTGEREKAKQAVRRLLEREPRNETAQKILRELESQ